MQDRACVWLSWKGVWAASGSSFPDLVPVQRFPSACESPRVSDPGDRAAAFVSFLGWCPGVRRLSCTHRVDSCEEALEHCLWGSCGDRSVEVSKFSLVLFQAVQEFEAGFEGCLSSNAA